MKIGILGLPLTGKTTIFSLLTNKPYDGSYKQDAEERVANVMDERLEKLTAMYNPKKTVHATLNFIDIPSYNTSADRKEKNRILQMIQTVDAIILVIRAFKNDSVPLPEGNELPVDQLDTLKTEMIIRDLEVVENRLARLIEQNKKKKPTKEDERQVKILEEIKPILEDGKFASKIELNEEDKKLISSLALFTLKPIITVVNIDDEQLLNSEYPGKDELINTCKEENFAYIEICGKTEADLIELEDDEKEEFMKELGIERSGIERLSKVVYDHLGLITFFTVGEDEVRAWTINKGITMKKAAGKIHSDLEKGFVKAEVMHYDDLIRLGSEEEVKKAGLWRLAGKEEIVKDGDILTIRANA
ncbi:redox-regulated ATPase YchF [Marinitoga sp. 38H-ov]|uniref:redox-regulated ATPase YchF n=1 Tax=Marinitoga sp. 38H-ov TaxID=1755814 RepID=UPI0013EA0396|nr:redox-regulated ATPase YchF [Marinitoga sp. 38H-ov]KAF2956997.1 GTP-binding protein [Marinitoga sp. 38H-ov]